MRKSMVFSDGGFHFRMCSSVPILYGVLRHVKMRPSLPPTRMSSVTVSLASLWTRRRDNGVTIGPIRTVLVEHAIAAIATQGSAMARAGDR